MADGTSVEVPYYWEENGEVKFEITGGVAGIPKGQVASVQEILAAKEFDPEVLLETPKDKATVDQQKVLQDLIASKPATGSSNYQKLDAEESSRLLKMSSVTGKGAPSSNERVYGPLFNVEATFSELVRTEGTNVMLVMRNIISSRFDLKNQNFMLTLYDGEGKALQKKSCELQPLDVDHKTLKQLDIRGKLYSVMASVRPDPKIKRFEITAVPR